ncbi:MAG: aspartyl/asparaginyl beta-hydroxylase domain-containing protein [Pseudomonadota bacterium]
MSARRLNKEKLLAGFERLDKASLIGGCRLLSRPVDVGVLRSEVDAIPQDQWTGPAGRVGVHAKADAVFLRGYAPTEGEQKPIEDRAILTAMPYANELIHSIGAKPLRCVLARLKAGDSIRSHIDRGPILVRSIRIHVPVITNDEVEMHCNGSAYRMKPGEVWVINNGAQHAAHNFHASEDRVHLICDYLPETDLLALVARGNRGLGSPLPGV